MALDEGAVVEKNSSKAVTGDKGSPTKGSAASVAAIDGQGDSPPPKVRTASDEGRRLEGVVAKESSEADKGSPVEGSEAPAAAINELVESPPEKVRAAIDERLAVSNEAVQRRLDALDASVAAMHELLRTVLNKKTDSIAAIGAPALQTAFQAFHDSLMQSSKDRRDDASVLDGRSPGARRALDSHEASHAVDKKRKRDDHHGHSFLEEFSDPTSIARDDVATPPVFRHSSSAPPAEKKKRGPKKGWKLALQAGMAEHELEKGAPLTPTNACVTGSPTSSAAGGAAPEKKRRGPKKGWKLAKLAQQGVTPVATTDAPPIKRKPGRPRKNPLPAVTIAALKEETARAAASLQPSAAEATSSAKAMSLHEYVEHSREQAQTTRSPVATQSNATLSSPVQMYLVPQHLRAPPGAGDGPVVKRKRGRPRKNPLPPPVVG
ncbi:Aste57867_12119 [Aphanomyces stellatus]|uniref:Aste57867_12119 protein n=1 Tax=Aphanomyces stellatus TaxID=120398 RepID=A0A485KUQ2_9STRA|nr:hypothetical protein As57867_012074 [Aphanomyces stellatus]VFT88973.1 Aste57867_12119 [Aphanomyces stellatus]